jgi:SpoIIAA-like
MVLRLGLEPPNLVIATVAGIVTTREQAELVAFIRSTISITGSARVLLCLELFAGWHPDARFDRDDLWLHDDEGVSKIAIVGPQEWKATVLTLLAQPVRRIPIAYFVTEPAARTWLGLDAVPRRNLVST